MRCFRTLSIKQLRTNNPEIARRLRRTAIKCSVIFGIAVAYLIFVLCTGIGIPCLFYKVTGLKCVGCGISRMLVCLVRLDFVSAFGHNPFLFITGPFLIVYLVCGEVKYVLRGSRRLEKADKFLWAVLVFAIAYGILRNIFPI